MRYTIITTTIGRESLLDTIASVDAQTCKDWEHLVVYDRPGEDWNLKNRELRRHLIVCAKAHHDFGDTCKQQAHRFARGEYLFYLDDDDTFAHDHALEDLRCVTERWATFPSWSHGKVLYSDPPAYSHLGGVNCLFHRSLPSWPVTGKWGADWEYIARLVASRLKPQAFPNLTPVARVEAHHYGR